MLRDKKTSILKIFFSNFQVKLESPNNLTTRQRDAMLEFSRDDDYNGGVFGSLRQGTVLFSNGIFSKLKVSI